MVTVEQLYKDFGILQDATNKSDHEEQYLSILSAVKGGASEKRLASQFIARFFKHFPELAQQSFNALFELCEDDDINIRKQAIKDLPSLCRVTPEFIPKIVEAMIQLMQHFDDNSELSLIQSSLTTLFSINCQGTLKGLFCMILGENDSLRDLALKFLTNKVKVLPDDTLGKEDEDLIVTECRKVLQDVTCMEFIAIMNLLKGLKSMSTVMGRQQLVDIIIMQAELEHKFKPDDPDCVDRLMQCIKQSLPLFSKNVHSKTFVGYMCDQVIPVMSELACVDEGTNVQLEMLKLFAEISEFAGELEDIEERVERVYEKLIEYMPLPPSDENDDISGESTSEEHKLQFSYVECLMYTFHQLGRKYPNFLSDESNADRLKDFRLRLQYFARGVQVYIKQLRTALQGKTGETLKTDENKIKVMALKITSNINILIKDLFHNPPAYKSVVTLSWKPIHTKSNPASIGVKRNSSDGSEYGTNRKSPKQDRALYAPPGGKYSQKAGTFPQANRGGWQQQRGGFGGFARGNRGRGGNSGIGLSNMNIVGGSNNAGSGQRGGSTGFRGRRF
ncbi:Apoptosis inhibitor 5,Apoptosis inhibitor 5 homolog,Apoptosis inhibitor 5-B,Apoptosis inhibitor 5-A [Acanthosepion pharaonis]|uniref:Apoptosis inhibitor 5,Apoptosis inhibitor 5 homolog,Apoptosis inhibitor 5-B,Apoptosis inhibitor 5-A n=1 Tax=Acanthosepion pharaonis TaxID=158019 RepID=A0A812BJU8_ACAPH|nr:Apoptosis inhibitor 5,Apoptosis inhibitor 5 homolog,Apoptosis inhibitor 5-B,Apoptosis inhibitor 5-A [Sepia pharaonis]